MEIWKDIEEFEGLYQVSNLGNVRSLNYRRTKGKIKNLIPKKNNSGRLWVELRNEKGKKNFLIHRLVGNAFIPNPNNLPQINHIDENPLNNCVNNLEWCTGEYNIKYSLRLHPKRKKITQTRKIIQRDKNGCIIRVWDNAHSIFLETRMSDWSIAECCRGNRHTAYGYTWQYAD